MLVIEHDPVNGWKDPEIRPYGPLSLDPSSSCFHYCPCVFEGMKVCFMVTLYVSWLTLECRHTWVPMGSLVSSVPSSTSHASSAPPRGRPYLYVSSLVGIRRTHSMTGVRPRRPPRPPQAPHRRGGALDPRQAMLQLVHSPYHHRHPPMYVVCPLPALAHSSLIHPQPSASPPPTTTA